MTATLKSYTPTRKPRPPAVKADPEPASVVPIPAPEPPATVDPLDSAFQPRMLTTEEVANWMSVNPGPKKGFINAKGELVRKWIEEYDWMTRPGGGVIKIPKWFGPETMDPKTGLFSPYVETTTQGSADRI